MNKKIFNLMIAVDPQSLVVTKNTTNAYLYVNRIPCKGCGISQKTQAQHYADDQIKQYQGALSSKLTPQPLPPSYAKNAKNKYSFRICQKMEVKELKQLLEVLPTHLTPQMRVILKDIENDVNGIQQYTGQQFQYMSAILTKIKDRLESQLE